MSEPINKWHCIEDRDCSPGESMDCRLGSSLKECPCKCHDPRLYEGE